MRVKSLFLLFLYFYLQGQILPAQETNLTDIYLIGNKRTKAQVILREISLQKGKFYTDSILNAESEKSQQRIYNTGLFNSVNFEFLETNDSTSSLLIAVKERWYLYPTPIFELDDRNLMDWIINRESDATRTNYGLKINHFNFLGLNHRVLFIGQTGFQNKITINYTAPYFDRSQRHGMIIEAALAEREDLAFRTVDHLPEFLSSERINKRSSAGQLTYIFRPGFHNFHYFSFNFQSTWVSDTVLFLNPEFFLHNRNQQRVSGLLYTYVRDFRDNRSYPTKGHYFRVIIEKKGIFPADDFSYTGLYFYQNLYKKWGEKWCFAQGSRFLWSSKNNIPYFNIKGIGFRDFSLRGYELEVIEIPSLAIFRTDIRYKLIEYREEYEKLNQFNDFKLMVFPKLMAETAFTSRYPNYKNNNRLTNRWLWAIGGGVDLLLPYDLVVRVENTYTAEKRFNFAINLLSAF